MVPVRQLSSALSSAHSMLDRPQKRLADPPSPPLPRAFSPWLRTCEGTAARQLATAVLQRLTDSEDRQRQRRESDEATFTTLVDALVANLLRCQLDPKQQADIDEKGGWVKVPLSRRKTGSAKVVDRYHVAPMPLSKLPDIVKAMAALDLVSLYKAPQSSWTRHASKIKCSDGLLELIDDYSPRLDQMESFTSAVDARGNLIQPEVIELREAADRGDAVTGVLEVFKRRLRRGPNRKSPPAAQYRDTARTDAWREQVQRINAALHQADITFEAGNGIIAGHRVPEQGVAIRDRFTRRIFNNERWDHGGRLYGGFWQGLPRELRDGIRIDGHRVVTVDFSSMFLQLLYAVKAKEQAPLDEPDLYERIDREAGWPNDPERKALVREAVKKIVNAMLFDDREDPRESLPKGTRPYIDKRTKWTDLVRRMKERHPPVARWVGTDVGFELMHHESEIMIATVLSCLDKGVVVLPIHDGLIVAEPHKEIARAAMQQAFRDYTGGFVARISG